MHGRANLLASLILLGTTGCGQSEPEIADRGATGPSEWSAQTAEVASGPPEYVGAETCRDCHAEEFELYEQSGHANTFHFATGQTAAERFTTRPFYDAERDVILKYLKTQRGFAASVPSGLGDATMDIQYVLGSGAHAQTCLTLIETSEGGTAGIEHRASWFASSQTLVRTPGQVDPQVAQPVEWFGKPIKGETLDRCIECHVTTATIKDATLHDLRPNVQCEACHGPGSDHVSTMRDTGRLDPSYAVNDRSALNEMQSCGRCHRFPESGDDPAITQDNHKIVRFQPVGLLQSRCYLESSQLTCSTCHDPHAPVSSKTPEQFELDCTSCHSLSPDSTAQADSTRFAHLRHPEDAFIAKTCANGDVTGCVRCHMPKIEVHPGLAFTDHWIRIRKDRN